MRCIVCGCTDDSACFNGADTCTWIHEAGDPPLCSFCERDDTLYEEDPSGDILVDRGSELILPGDPEFHL